MDLLELAKSVVAQAAAGEQVEAYASRSNDTEIRVYEGDIEHLQSAQSAGVGIRVIRDGRTGFAYTAALDPKSVADTLAEARDNAAFGTSDEWAGLAVPDGVAVVRQNLWSEELAGTSTDAKLALAFDLEKRTLGIDSRIRVESAEYADGFSEGAVATSTGIAVFGRDSGCYVSSAHWSTMATRRRPGTASPSAVTRRSSISKRPRSMPYTARRACWAPPSRRAGVPRLCSIRW
jgi:PmbA protein